MKLQQTYFLIIFAKKSPPIPRPNSKNYRNLSENDVLETPEKLEIKQKNST